MQHRNIPLTNIDRARLQCPVPELPDGKNLSYDSAALSLMVNLDHIFCVSRDMTLNHALEIIRSSSLKTLIVIGQETEFVGVLRATDIMGRKPTIIAAEQQIHRDEIKIDDIMVPKHSLHALSYSQVLQSMLGDVLTTLRNLGEPELLVVDGIDNGYRVRGILSAAIIAHHLHADFEPHCPAPTFATLYATLRV